MALGYRSVIHLGKGLKASEVAETEFFSWLAGTKKIAIPKELSPDGTFNLASGRTLTITDALNNEDGFLGKSFEFAEKTSGRLWSVYLHAVENMQDQSKQIVVVEVDISVQPGENPTDIVAPPNLVKALLKKYDATDGHARMNFPFDVISTPEMVTTLVKEICDPKRELTINVAPSQGEEFDAEWYEIVESLNNWGVGNSATYIISREQVRNFNTQISHAFSVAPGSVRSFQPGVDIRNPDDSFRHRYLKTTNLQKSIYNSSNKWKVALSLQKGFGRNSRQRFVQSNSQDFIVPPILSALRDKISLIKAQSRRPAKTQEPTNLASDSLHSEPKIQDAKVPPLPSKIVSVLNRMQVFVRRFTDAPDVSVESIDGLEEIILKDLDDKVEVEKLFNQSEARLASAVEAAEKTEYRIRNLERLNKEYREQLFSRRGHVVTQPQTNWGETPYLMEEIVSRISPEGDPKWGWLREKVVFTGNERATLVLDEKAIAQRYAATTWEFIEVMYDFVSVKQGSLHFEGGMDFYLKNPGLHFGRVSGSSNHSSESLTVRNGRKVLKRLRELPVPLDVNPNGVVHMWDHFKIDTSDSNSPRLHYYYDSSGAGKIYIGYIGKHLPTE